MSTKDIGLFESGNGGEISIQNSDIALFDQIYVQPILAMFGGNVEASTLGNEVAGQVREDYWMNSLIFPNDRGRQFNSQTELALRQNALTSPGRVNIERAVQADLQYLSGIAIVSVNVVILSTNKVKIAISLSRPNNNQSANLQIIWDNARQEMIIEQVI